MQNELMFIIPNDTEVNKTIAGVLYIDDYAYRRQIDGILTEQGFTLFDRIDADYHYINYRSLISLLQNNLINF